MAFYKRKLMLLLAIVLLISYSSLFIQYERANATSNSLNEVLLIKTGKIAIAADLSEPLYLLQPEKSDEILIVKLNGIYEAWIQPYESFRSWMLFNDSENYSGQIMNKIRRRGTIDPSTVEKLRQLIDDLKTILKSPLDNVNETMTKISNYRYLLEGIRLPHDLNSTKNAVVKSLTDIEGILNKNKVENPGQVIDRTLNLLDELDNSIYEKIVEERGKDIAIYEKFIRIEEFRERVFKVARRLHPFSFPFSGGKWVIENLKNVTDLEGNNVGIFFNFKLEDVKNKGLNFLVGKVEVENRMYYFPVREMFYGVDRNLTSAELALKLTINGWELNYDKVIKALGEHSPLLSAHYRPYLVLSISIGVNRGNIEQVFESIKREGISLSLETEESFIRGNSSLSVEIPLGNAIAFVEFPSRAFILNNNVSKYVSVTTANERNNDLKVYLLYPYENNCTLEHDLKLGIRIVENPVYEIREVSGEIYAEKPPSEVLGTLFGREEVLALLLVVLLLFMLGIPKRNKLRE